MLEVCKDRLDFSRFFIHQVFQKRTVVLAVHCDRSDLRFDDFLNVFVFTCVFVNNYIIVVQVFLRKFNDLLFLYLR